jgi:D-aminopeptidase
MPRTRDLGIRIGHGQPAPRKEGGSIIGIVATDAPLLPHRCERLAKRAAVGVARVGGYASHGSEAVEEAIVNVLVAAETMVGRDGITAHALPHDRLIEVMRRYGRNLKPSRGV